MKKILIKSCCGADQYNFILDSAVKKSHVQKFKEAGYNIPQHFIDAGLFYVYKDGVIANAAFGSTQVKVRFSKKSEEQLKNFEELIVSLTTK